MCVKAKNSENTFLLKQFSVFSGGVGALPSGSTTPKSPTFSGYVKIV